MAYITDIKEYSEEIFESLKGVKLLFLSALRQEKSPLHLNLEEAVKFAEKVGAQKTYLIHLSQDLLYEETNQMLPPSVQLGYDGLTVAIP